MSNTMGVFVPVSPDGPAMRRRRGELPPPRQPRLNEFRVAKFAHRLFNEKAEEEWRNLAAADWRAFVNRRFKLTDDQRGALAAMDEAVVARIAEAVRQLLESGGEASIVLPEGRNGGQLVFEATGRKKRPVLECSFDANCRNWKCEGAAKRRSSS